MTAKQRLDDVTHRVRDTLRREPATAGVLLVLVAFAVVTWGPLFTGGAGLLYTDEMYGFVQSRSAEETGDLAYALPHRDVVGGAFRPMGSSGGAAVTGGISPVFLHMLAPATAWGVLGGQVAAGAVALVLLTGVFLFVRQAHGARAGLAAAAVTAALPPVLFWATFFMANVAVVAFFALSLACLAAFVRTDRLPWAVVSMGLLLVAVSMRRDTLAIVAPFVLVMGIRGFRRPVLWVLLVVAAYGALAGYLYAMRIAPTVPTALRIGPEDLRAAYDSLFQRYGAYHPETSWSIFRSNMRTYVLALYPLVALLGGIGLLFQRYRSRALALVGVGLLISASAYVAIALTVPPTWGHDPPGVMSSLVRYSLIVPVVLAVGAAALVSTLARAWPERWRALVVVGVTAALVVPGAAQSAMDEPGSAWLAGERERRSAFDALAAELPANAYLVGDEPSKFVTSRLVLVPFNIPQREDRVPRYVDALAAREGLQPFIHHGTFYGDWSGLVGEYVTDAHHYATPSGVGDFYAINRTNSTLVNVGILGDEGMVHWNQSEDGLLHSRLPYSFVTPTPRLKLDLEKPPSPGLVVSFTVRDDRAAWHEAGYVNAPFGPNNVQVTHRWLGTGNGEWRTEAFFVPADTVVNGPLYFSEGLTFRDLRIEAIPGALEQ